jgi:hypothetical protein
VASANNYNVHLAGARQRAERRVFHRVSARLRLHPTQDDAQHSDAGYSLSNVSTVSGLILHQDMGFFEERDSAALIGRLTNQVALHLQSLSPLSGEHFFYLV